jgi:hypothetical protein
MNSASNILHYFIAVSICTFGMKSYLSEMGNTRMSEKISELLLIFQWIFYKTTINLNVERHFCKDKVCIYKRTDKNDFAVPLQQCWTGGWLR